MSRSKLHVCPRMYYVSLESILDLMVAEKWNEAFSYNNIEFLNIIPNLLVINC